MKYKYLSSLVHVRFDLFLSKGKVTISFADPFSGIIDNVGIDTKEVVLDKKASHFPEGDSEALLNLLSFSPNSILKFCPSVSTMKISLS